jgi:cold-inducible RNA-binding protein
LSKRLFIGNLSFNVTEDELRQQFEPYGVTDASIPGAAGGRKGFGFVDVAPDRAVAAISEMSGKELDGRAIDVKEAKPKVVPDEGGRGGFRGGGRGGYGGHGGGGRRW